MGIPQTRITWARDFPSIKRVQDGCNLEEGERELKKSQFSLGKGESQGIEETETLFSVGDGTLSPSPVIKHQPPSPTTHSLFKNTDRSHSVGSQPSKSVSHNYICTHIKYILIVHGLDCTWIVFHFDIM